MIPCYLSFGFFIFFSRNDVRAERKRRGKGMVIYASLFGVGAPEALVIGVVALLVFGPKGLAEVSCVYKLKTSDLICFLISDLRPYFTFSLLKIWIINY